MVVDTSALLAIALLEPESMSFLLALDASESPPIISAASVAEAGIVIEKRAGRAAADKLDRIIEHIGLKVEPVTADQARLARVAYRAFGKGNHPAGLNFGDCFAYALAKATGLPLLFKGDDFARTDIPRAGATPR